MRQITFKRGQRYDVRFHQAEIVTLRATLTDEDGTAIDLTGKTCSLVLVINPFDTSAAHTVAGSLVALGVTGIVDFPITATHTASVRNFYAQIRYTSAGADDTHVAFEFRVLRDYA